MVVAAAVKIEQREEGTFLSERQMIKSNIGILLSGTYNGASDDEDASVDSGIPMDTKSED